MLSLSLGPWIVQLSIDLVDPTDVNIVAEPALAFPLGSVNLTMEHLLAPDDSLIYNDNATYKVVVAKDSVFGINVNDLISIPAQSPSSNAISMGTIAVDNVSISQSIALGAIASDAGLTLLIRPRIKRTFPIYQCK